MEEAKQIKNMEDNKELRELFIIAYDTYFDKVNKYLRYRVNSTWDADDLTAQVFIKAFENFYQCRTPEKPGAWIFRIAHTTYVDYLRKRQEHFALDEELLKIEQKGGPEEAAIISEEITELKECLEQLSQDQRDVIILRYFSDLKYRQIAGILGKNASTVKTIGFRAIRKLRELWQGGGRIDE